VARNRKRAKERRPRQPGAPVDPHQGLPTATHGFDNGAPELERENGASESDQASAELEPVDIRSDSLGDELGPEPLEDHDEGAPPPLEHATPDVELAEEQLAYGRPREPEPDDEADEEEFEREVEESISAGRGGRGGRRRGGGYDGGASSGAGGELAAPGAAAVPEHRPSVLARLIAFLQGSWRELQRVQWPDRRHVAQATGVVIGFVIVAAVFLGVADWASGKLVSFILK
jgi:preprotein translocase SecE subunit